MRILPSHFATLRCLLLLTVGSSIATAAITISNIVDKTKYDAPRTFTVTADPNASTTTATLDGVPITVGPTSNVTAFGYHELKAESRTAGNVLVDSQLVRFITRDPSRGDTEDGIPPHTPFRTVNDAPSAFAGQTLKVIAPASWPIGLPIPVATVLRNASNETVRLNGLVTFGGLPLATLQMRRGWGSVVAPAATAAGPLSVVASLNGLTANPSVFIEAAPVFTNVSGTLAANTTWPANSRIHVTGTLTVNAGVTLTIGAGTIVKVYTGTGTAGSAAEIVVNGTLQINGLEASPVVFTPDTAGQYWGGIELPVATSIVNATNAIFHGSGEDTTWFNTHSGYSTHKPQQALFLVAGSGTGTAIGAQLHLTSCYCFSLAGQMMNSKTNTQIDLQRTLMQKAITCGELNGSKVTIDRCALIEFPSEDATFVDADNDALYMTNGNESISNTVIGFGKDDGVDTGGNGGDNPYTAAADVTPFTSTNNWYEGTFHEGNSLSGTRNVTFTGCVFLNCGQGVEAGYSTSATGDGPNALVDGCLFASNMVGVRWGDNYGNGYSYNPSMEVKNSLVLNSFYHDAFSGQWHPTQTNAWIYQTTATNTFGHPYFNVHNNYLSQPDAVHHPANTTWDPTNPTHAIQIEPFMPVPGSKVGVAISSYATGLKDTVEYPGIFTVRLSTFSSKPVSVNWAVLGKVDAFSDSVPITLASGALTFQPGETIKTITATFPSPINFGLLHVSLTNPLNAEVTGEAIFIKPTVATSQTLIATGSTGWRYRETRSEPPATWKQLNFDDSSAAATEWLACTMPAGFGVSGVTFGTTVNGGSTSDRTKAVYFRKKITVADPAQFTGVTMRVRRDDAAVVWVNNEASPSVVSADGAFSGPYSYAMSGVPSSTNTGAYLSYAIPPAKFVTGQNIIAIEVHQTSLTSSDLLLDVELTTTVNVPLQLNFTRSDDAMLLWWFGPGDLLERSFDLVNWLPAPFPSGPVSVPFDVSQEFFRLRR